MNAIETHYTRFFSVYMQRSFSQRMQYIVTWFFFNRETISINVQFKSEFSTRNFSRFTYFCVTPYRRSEFVIIYYYWSLTEKASDPHIQWPHFRYLLRFIWSWLMSFFIHSEAIRARFSPFFSLFQFLTLYLFPSIYLSHASHLFARSERVSFAI